MGRIANDRPCIALNTQMFNKLPITLIVSLSKILNRTESGTYSIRWIDHFYTRIVKFRNCMLESDAKGRESCHIPQCQWSVIGWNYPDSKVHGANVGPIWDRQDPDGPHYGPTNLAIWVLTPPFISASGTWSSFHVATGLKTQRFGMFLRIIDNHIMSTYSLLFYLPYLY